MSAAIVRQALEIVDPGTKLKGTRKKSKSDAFSLFPEKYKIVGRISKKGSKAERSSLPVEKKYTVQDAKKSFKTKQQIIKENIEKLELIKKHSRVVLDDNSTRNIIERGVTRRPIKTGETSTKSKTAFTEEDFKKFEEEYFNSDD